MAGGLGLEISGFIYKTNRVFRGFLQEWSR